MLNRGLPYTLLYRAASAYDVRMHDDDHVCLCFRVSKGKIVSFCKRRKPPVASLISECLSAGTGCGWCVPFLKMLHSKSLRGDSNPDLPFCPLEYAQGRVKFRQTGKREQEERQSDKRSL